MYCSDPSWWPFRSTEHEWNTEYRAGLIPWYVQRKMSTVRNKCNVSYTLSAECSSKVKCHSVITTRLKPRYEISNCKEPSTRLAVNYFSICCMYLSANEVLQQTEAPARAQVKIWLFKWRSAVLILSYLHRNVNNLSASGTLNYTLHDSQCRTK